MIEKFRVWLANWLRIPPPPPPHVHQWEDEDKYAVTVFGGMNSIMYVMRCKTCGERTQRTIKPS